MLANGEQRLSRNFFILSVDGGGFRGLFAAHLLRRMEQEWQIEWRERFGLFAGTSTGAILAGGLASGISAGQLADLYTSHGTRIFRRRIRSRIDFPRLFTSRYSHAELRRALETTFGNITLGELSVPLVVPAVDIGNGQVHVLKSKFHNEFVRDPHVRVSDAILASCSAPTYFDPHVVSEYQLCDGGLWANNPSLAAVVDAHYRLGIPLQRIRVLSVGTGTSRVFYPRSIGGWHDRLIRSWQGWGLATRWQRSRLLDLILTLQSESTNNTLCLLFGTSPLASTQVLRLTFESDRPLPMDFPGKAKDWIAKADYTFTHRASQIADFLATGGTTK